MDLRKRLTLIFLLYLSLDPSNGYGEFDDTSLRISRKSKRNGSSEVKHTENRLNEGELIKSPFCSNCKISSTTFPNSIADKISLLRGRTPSLNHRDRTRLTRTKVIPKESEKIAFSQKYDPDLGTENDGFIPIPGPYGTRSRRLRENTSITSKSNISKLPVDNLYKSTPSTRRPSKRSHDKNYHITRQTSRIKRPQIVQRRAQYRYPKIPDELAVKESVSSENILGNGHFEIIKGGIFSDHDSNEILGSRRSSRGFGSYIMPTYRQSQNRFTSSVQNVQFPHFYQGRIQNPVQPMFYRRAPF